MAKPVVDADTCTGCELCCGTAPNTFAMNDDGVATVIKADGDPDDVIQEAADDCPVEAITME